MHEITVCDFSVTLPTFEKVKPIPGRQLNSIYTSELVNAIINEVDKFYSNTIRPPQCRRRFIIFPPYVVKYYPQCYARKQESFLHKKQPNNMKRSNPKYKKSFSMIETSSKDGLENSFYMFKRINICKNFLLAERLSNDLQYNEPDSNKNMDSISSNIYAMNLSHLSNRIRPGSRSGISFKKTYRKSFPLMSSGSGSVSCLISFLTQFQ